MASTTPVRGVPVTLSNTEDNLSLAPGTDLGVWKATNGDENVILSGRASYNGTGYVGISDPGNGFLLGFTNIPVAAAGWKTVYDIAPVMADPDFGYNAPDQLSFGTLTTNINPDTTDTEAYTLYNQVLTTVTVSANPTNPPNPATKVPVTVTALDQFGKPIAGCELLQ